jgi:rsbT antagonist protein RsbS
MEKIPVIKMGRFLVVTIQEDMDDRLVLHLQDTLTEQIAKYESRGVLIDISLLDIVDSFIGRMLATISSMSYILGAKTVVVGMQPAVAITIVELGLNLRGVHTALNVEKGLQMLGATNVGYESTGSQESDASHTD